MHHRMAIEATPIECEYGICTQRSGLVPSLHMALLAKARYLGHEHFVAGGAVGRMAGEAVFFNGRVFPEEWRLFLGVAFITLVVKRLRLDKFFRPGAVGVMAGRAGHFSFGRGR